MTTYELGGGGVKKGTYDLLLQHVRADVPTPFKPPESILGRIGMAEAVTNDEGTDAALPIPDALATTVAKERGSGFRVSGVLRLFANISDKFGKH